MHCHHEKTIVIDDRVAFVGGIELTFEHGDRFDSSEHVARGSVGWHDLACRLTGAAVNAEDPLVIRRVRDLESFLDRLAVLELPRETQPSPAKTDRVTRTRRNVIAFAPEGAHGVAAYIDGEKTATA